MSSSQGRTFGFWCSRLLCKMFSNSVKIECVLWYSDSKSPTKVRRKFKAKYGRNKKAPDNRSLKIWYENFRENGSISIKKNRNKTIGIEPIIQSYENDPKQSLRRDANQVGVCHSTVRRALKFSEFKVYRPAAAGCAGTQK